MPSALPSLGWWRFAVAWPALLLRGLAVTAVVRHLVHELWILLGVARLSGVLPGLFFCVKVEMTSETINYHGSQKHLFENSKVCGFNP